VRVALVVAVLVLSATAARANPFDYIPFGARAMGMGGAYGALASDYSANFYNPAGLATRDDLQLSIGYTLVQPTLTLNDEDLDVDAIRGFQGGLVMPGKVWGHRLALSVALHLPDERVTRLRALPESQPRFVLYDNHPQRIVLTTSVGFEVVKDLVYVGVGLTYLSDTQGRLRVTGDVDLQDENGTTLLSAVDVDFKAVRYPSAGILLTPRDDLRIGLTYRDEFDLSLDIGVVVNGDIVINGGTPERTPIVEGASLEVTSKNSNLFSPRQLALSIAWTPELCGLGWAFAGELTWSQWSRFISPTALLGTSLTADPLPLRIPPNPAPTDPRFHDTLVPRLGAEVKAIDGANVDLTVRLGSWFERSPAPTQTGNTNYTPGVKLGFGLGFTLDVVYCSDIFPKPLSLDFGALLEWMPERTHNKSNPADPVGDYRSAGTLIGFTTGLRFAF